MIVIVKPSGNHSNRLFQAINFESFCLEHKINYYNPTFYDMAKFYGVRSRFFDKYLAALLKLLGKIFLLKVYHFKKPGTYQDLWEVLIGKKICFVDGWHFRRMDLTEKFREYFIEKYSLEKDIYKNNQFVKKIEEIKKYKILVGIHIRRGDYIDFFDGIYYYDDNIYLKYVIKMRQLVKSELGREAFFIIFSNEEVSFGDIEDLVVSREAWYIDHLLMSWCDYLIGPPSTFTMWASYIGKNKYFHILNAGKEMAMEDFSECVGLPNS